MRRSPLLALGLDGGDLGFIRRHRQSLPSLAAALEGGRLYEPRPPYALSGSVWPTFYNGRQPGEHGLYQHLVWDPRRMGLRRIAPDWCFYRPFWQELERLGLDVTVFDVPYSFPGTLRSGVEIMDWGTHGQTWPQACNDPAIRRWLGRSPIGRETPVRKTPAQLEKIRLSLLASARLKGRLICRLLRERNPDVLIAVFGETHRGGHTLFSREDHGGPADAPTALLDVYRAVDEAIGKILQGVDRLRTPVLIFSVHGMAPDRAQGHLVRPVLGRINEAFAERHLGLPASKPRNPGLVRFLRERVPDRVQHAAGAAAPDRVRQWIVEREIVGAVDWKRTPGFALRTDIRTELRLNLRGREARGLLEPDGELRHRYVEFLEQTFMNLVDADSGKRLVDEVVSIPELFPGPRADRLPDLVINWRPRAPVARVSAPGIGVLRAQPAEPRGGDHTEHGFAALTGLGHSRELPPLEHTADFAAFIRAIAEDPGQGQNHTAGNGS